MSVGSGGYISIVSQINRIISGSDDFEEVLRGALEVTHAYFSAERAEIYIGGALFYRWFYGGGSEILPFNFSGRENSFFFKEGEVFLSGHGGNTCLFALYPGKNIPLWNGGEAEALKAVLGIIAVFISSEVAIRRFSEDTLFFEAAFRGKKPVPAGELEPPGTFSPETKDFAVKSMPEICHEIRTPLHSILGFIELLRPHVRGSDGAGYLNGLSSCAFSAAKNASSVFEGAAVRSGSVKFIEFVPERELSGIICFFQAEAMSKGAALFTYMDPDTPVCLYGDVFNLKWVLTHVLGYGAEVLEQGMTARLKICKESLGGGAVLHFSLSIAPAPSAYPSSGGVLFAGLRAAFRRVLDAGGSFDFSTGDGTFLKMDFRLPFIVRSPKIRTVKKRGKVLCVDFTGEPSHIKDFASGMGYRAGYVPPGGFTPEACFVSFLVFDRDAHKKIAAIKNMAGKTPVIATAFKADLREAGSLRDEGGALLMEPVSLRGYESVEDIFGKRELWAWNGNDKRFFKGRVLVAEDNPVNGRMITILLNKCGLDVTLVTDGSQAAAIFDCGFDLIFMDINMPVMNGVEAARAIIASAGERGITPPPIAALTANISSDYDTYIEAGMDSILAKPVTMDRLKNFLSIYLKENPCY